MSKNVYGVLRKYKWLLITLVVIGVLGCIGWWSWNWYQAKQEADKKPPYLTEIITLGDIEVVVSATGTIKAANSVDVSSNVAGTIKKMLVKENQQVEKGQLLVRMDSDKLRSQLAQAEIRFENVKTQYERMYSMHSKGAVARKDYDDAYMNYVIAKEQCDELQAQMNDTDITAPISGSVVGKPRNEGESIVTGGGTPMVILTVADLSKMQVDTQVDAADIGKVSLGQLATFTVDTYPYKVFRGRVSNISKKSSTQQNVVYYSVLIDVEGDNAEKLFPGMTARVSIIAGKANDVIVLPLSAIKEQKGKHFVSVITDGKEEEVPVTVGMSNDEKAEITSGLTIGQEVITVRLKTQDDTKKGGGVGLKIKK